MTPLELKSFVKKYLQGRTISTKQATKLLITLNKPLSTTRTVRGINYTSQDLSRYSDTRWSRPKPRCP